MKKESFQRMEIFARPNFAIMALILEGKQNMLRSCLGKQEFSILNFKFAFPPV